MTAESYPGDALLSTESRSAESGSPQIASGLALMDELEASLQASQRALLAHDLASLEHRTGEQLRLCRALEIFGTPYGAPRAGSEFSHASPQFAAELRAAQKRVLHQGRVQLALLGRAQRWLRTLSHLMAGPGASYSASLGRRGPQYAASPDAGRGTSADLCGISAAEERDPCRA